MWSQWPFWSRSAILLILDCALTVESGSAHQVIPDLLTGRGVATTKSLSVIINMQRYDDGGSFARALADVLHRLALSQSQRFLPLDLVVHMVNDQLTRDFGRSPNASESGIDARPAPVSLDGPLGRLDRSSPTHTTQEHQHRMGQYWLGWEGWTALISV